MTSSIVYLARAVSAYSHDLQVRIPLANGDRALPGRYHPAYVGIHATIMEVMGRILENGHAQDGIAQEEIDALSALYAIGRAAIAYQRDHGKHLASEDLYGELAQGCRNVRVFLLHLGIEIPETPHYEGPLESRIAQLQAALSRLPDAQRVPFRG